MGKFWVTAVVAMVVSWGAGASETEIPNIDVEAHCKRAADLFDGSRSVELTCLKQEQESYGAVKAKWDDYPAAVRAVCAKQPSYQFVFFCLDREVKAAAEIEKFEFKR